MPHDWRWTLLWGLASFGVQGVKWEGFIFWKWKERVSLRNPIFLCLFWTKLFINVTSKCLLRMRWGVTRPLQRICMRVPNEQVKEDTIWVAYFLFLWCMSAFFFRGPYGNSWKLGVLISHIEEVDASDYSFFVCVRVPISTAGIGCLAWRFGPRNNTECCIKGHGGNVIS